MARTKQAKVAQVNVEVTRAGRGERTSTLVFAFKRADGARDLKAERGLDAAAFRLAARLTEETPDRERWAVYCQAGAGGARVAIELAEAAEANDREQAAAWATIARAIGSAGAPAPNAPNMSRVYAVEA